MTDCNARAGQYAGMSKDDCISSATEAIKAITDHATVGLCHTVKLSDFEEVMSPGGYMTNPFSLCVHGALMMCKDWADENDPAARIVYVFEAGDTHQTDANTILLALAEDPVRRQFFRYENHAFLPKRGSMPTQAADILAWHSGKQYNREDRGIARLRGDFSELVDKVQTRKFLMGKEEMLEIRKLVTKHVPIPFGEAIAGLALRRFKGSEDRIHRQTLALLLQGN